MRSWGSRNGEVYGLSNRSPQLLESADSRVRESLKHSLESANFDHPDMQKHWNQIGVALLAELDNGSVDSAQYFKRGFDALNLALGEVEKFEAQYSDFLLETPKANQITVQKNILQFKKKLTLSLYWLYNKIGILKSEVKKVRAIRDWLGRLHSDVLAFLIGREFPKPVLSEIIGLLEIFCDSEILKLLSKTHVESQEEDHDLQDILRSIDIYSQDIRVACHNLKKVVSGIPFELEEEIIYLSPDSAEGKAVQRISNFESDDDLVTIVDDDEEFLPETEELRDSGWIVKTVSQIKQELELLSRH